MSEPQGEGSPPRVRFEAIGGAWSLYQQQMGMWILISLVIVLIGVAINSLLEILLGPYAYWLIAVFPVSDAIPLASQPHRFHHQL